MTVDRIDELQLAIDTALRQAPASDAVSLKVTPAAEELLIELGPFVIDATGRMACERVLSALVPGSKTRDSGREAWLEMQIPLPAHDRG
ncbi:MAG: hypothetical protein R6W48_09220 [Gaiellaceae bacterium]